MHRGGEILVRDERLRPTEVFQDAAIETEWITAEEIDDTPAQSVAEVLEHRAGIRTQQRIQGQDAAVSIEGMPPEYTRILVDGRPWSGEIGGVGDLQDVPLQNVERIELLRGSQGMRYGTDAGGGVINVVTRRAPDAGWRAEAGGVGGSDEKWRGGATGAWRLGPLGLSLSGDYDTVNGFDPPTGDETVFTGVGGDESRVQSWFLYGKWELPISETVELRGNGIWRVEDDDLVPEDTGFHLPRRETSWRGNLGLDGFAGDATTVAGDFDYYAVETDSDVGRSFVLAEDELRGDLHFDHFLTTGPVAHSLLGGADIAWQRIDLDEGTLPDGIDNDDLARGRRVDEDFLVPSVYLQNESEITDRLTLVLGVRGRFHSEFPARALPQAGVLIEPLDGLKLRASWGLNYRTPSLRDLHQPATPQLGGAYFLAGNPDLDPERSMSIRAGFEWSPSRWVSLASTGFYNDIDDHIRSALAGPIEIGRATRLIDPADFEPALIAFCEAQVLLTPRADWTPECEAWFTGMPIERTDILRSNVFEKSNLDAVRTWGAESQLRLRIPGEALGELTLGLDYTWLRTRVRDSNVNIDELPNEPEHALSVRGLYVVPRLGTRLSAAFRWRDSVVPEGSGTGLLSFADASERLDPTHQLDLRVSQPLRDFGRLYLDAFNVTNERREDSYAIRGTTLLVGISLDFAGGAE